MLLDYYDNLPDYYDTMYLDGYQPWEILEAQHRSMIKQHREREAQRREEAATEKAIEAALGKAVSKALDDIFKKWK